MSPVGIPCQVLSCNYLGFPRKILGEFKLSKEMPWGFSYGGLLLEPEPHGDIGGHEEGNNEGEVFTVFSF